MKKVITYGTFDMLHEGHMNLLRNAKKLGGHLTVGVTSEGYDQYRGKLNVAQSTLERIESVRRTGLADEILVEEYEGQKIDDIQRLGIDIFAIGSDWVGRFDFLKPYCEVVYLERTKGVSSTMLRDGQRPFLRFGIVGAGRITGRFIMESKFVSGVTVDGVYGPREAGPRALAEQYELSFFTTDYDALLERVNAVYIASPHLTHYDYARRAILRGKHVLCEKPLSLSHEEAMDLFSLARQQGVVLMEAVKTAYMPAFRRLVSLSKSGKIGTIRSVNATFTKLVPHGLREWDASAGGSVTELASYPLLAVFSLLGLAYRELAFTVYSDEKTGLDALTRVDLWYDGAMATATVGLGVKSEGSLVVSGTRGYVYVPAPWWLTEGFELRYEDPAALEKNFFKLAGDGLRYEIVEFAHQISEGKGDAQAQAISLATAQVIGAFRCGENIRRV